MIMIWVYNKHKVKHKSYIKYDSDTCADIELIIEYLAESTCNHLPAMHAITGCDPNCYFYKVIKIKVLQNMKKQIESCEYHHVKQFIRISSKQSIFDLLTSH